MNRDAARALLRAWDTQQDAYVAHREQRFTVMLETIRLHLGTGVRVLDLACGPGALSDRVLTGLPGSTVVALDYDPILLEIARGALPADRARVLDVDLVAPGWESSVGEALVGEAPLGEASFDAVVSSTALHWLSPAQLLGVYAAAARVLRPGGLLLNADHLRYTTPTLRAVAEQHDAETQRAAFAAGALDYDAWYAEARKEPALDALAEDRAKRFADRPPQLDAPLDLHLAALRTAGFAEVGTVWQYLDDYVVAARR
ncbi:class I SAM-dependent methyltransferase [Cryptosporangium aurantiacum]|uniref:Methyltransferase domain-containing protein n=1 Tax=Cryptosporangium aurantiacum TaxID=134849 RepID=A0A1M7RKL6_9ACTN|nr:class I SAM-dependent methyltransferase [Cryptosporangium aurantiacum]SHN46699.1 Methyltransferase domain-containing protein [Cryptosporangium aurantiacum]